jgi:hypothetical protein
MDGHKLELKAPPPGALTEGTLDALRQGTPTEGMVGMAVTCCHEQA